MKEKMLKGVKNASSGLLPYASYLYMRRLAFRIQRPDQFRHMQNMRRGVDEKGYSYKPFDDLQCIFVHIPKCAGISICKAMFGGLAGGHTTLSDYAYVFNAREFVSYFKFTIVRNPWDRLVSAYHFLRQGGFDARDKAWAESNIMEYKEFSDFVTNWVTEENIMKKNHFIPQSFYLSGGGGKIKLDYIAYLENLSEDVKYVENRVGMKLDISNLNKSNHKDYKGYYNDETRKIVAKIYSDDIELLGYTFDNSNMSSISR